MKFLLTYQSHQSEPPNPETMAAIGHLTQEMRLAGALVMTGGFVRPRSGVQLEQQQGTLSVTDAPSADPKESIDRFALIRANSKQEAIEVAKRFVSAAGDGQGEMVEVFDAADHLPPGVGPG